MRSNQTVPAALFDDVVLNSEPKMRPQSNQCALSQLILPAFDLDTLLLPPRPDVIGRENDLAVLRGHRRLPVLGHLLGRGVGVGQAEAGGGLERGVVRACDLEGGVAGEDEPVVVLDDDGVDPLPVRVGLGVAGVVGDLEGGGGGAIGVQVAGGLGISGILRVFGTYTNDIPRLHRATLDIKQVQ